jgi:hypothetical protein
VLGDVSAERTVGPIDVVVVTAVDGHRKPGVGDKHGLRAASGGNRVGDRDEHDDLPSLPFERARGARRFLDERARCSDRGRGRLQLLFHVLEARRSIASNTPFMRSTGISRSRNRRRPDLIGPVVAIAAGRFDVGRLEQPHVVVMPQRLHTQIRRAGVLADTQAGRHVRQDVVSPGGRVKLLIEEQVARPSRC